MHVAHHAQCFLCLSEKVIMIITIILLTPPSAGKREIMKHPGQSFSLDPMFSIQNMNWARFKSVAKMNRVFHKEWKIMIC